MSILKINLLYIRQCKVNKNGLLLLKKDIKFKL